MKQTINALGWQCPKPIIATKKALDNMAEGEVLTIVDNKIALDNLVDFANSLGYQVSYEEEGGIYNVTTVKDKDAEEQAVKQEENLVIVVTSDQFGVGSEEFGRALMKTYLYSLPEADKKPNTLIFINSGVFLNCVETGEADTIQALEALGVEILTCGACLNFYGLTEQLAVGSISNMYNIVAKMNNATNTIKI